MIRITIAVSAYRLRFWFFIIVPAIIINQMNAFAADSELPPPVPSDSVPIVKPKKDDVNDVFYALNQSLTKPFIRSFDMARHLRTLTNEPLEALGIDTFDNVPNSTWFTNRIGMHNMTEEEIARGPNTDPEPDTAHYWTLIRVTSDSDIPRLIIRDCHNNDYIIKSTHPEYPELAIGAEMISTKIFYAAGYNVPANYISELTLSRLIIGNGHRYKNSMGNWRPFTMAEAESLFAATPRLPNGKIQVLASRIIAGDVLGGWNPSGTRLDDPNDRIPHERRRELRGLRIIASWLNHADFKMAHNLDVYDTNTHFVRHYLIDFSNTLGAGAKGPKQPSEAHEPIFKFSRLVRNIFVSGFNSRKWEKYDSIPYPSVGLWEAETFEPQHYSPGIPCSSFEDMTDRDAYWGARIVMSFTDEQLDAIVKTARYSDPAAEAYVAKVLKKRRDIIGRYYFDKISSLENFTLTKRIAGNGHVLRFTDLAVERGLMQSEHRRYRYCWHSTGQSHRKYIIQSDSIIISPESLVTSDSDYSVLHVCANRFDSREWGRDVRVYLRKSHDGDGVQIAGVAR